MEPALRIKAQRGFLLILAIVLILIVGFVGAMLVSMFVGGSNSAINVAQSSQALYIAQSGMEIAKRDIVVNDVACSGINGTAKYTAANFANGQFTVTGSSNTAATTLAADINSTDLSPAIVLQDASGFTANGGIVGVDSELFYYSSISGNTLQNVKRAVSGTAIGTHVHGLTTSVSQNQCVLTAVGAVPTIAASSAKRTISEALPVSFSGFSINGMTPSVIALGDANLSGQATIVNPTVWYTPPPASPEFLGSTIVTASNLNISGQASTKVCGCSTSACLNNCINVSSSSPDTDLVLSTGLGTTRLDVQSHVSGLSSTNLFSQFFSLTKAQMLSYVQTPQSTTQYFSSSQNLSSLNGIAGKTIWINGDLNGSGQSLATIGTKAQPVILIITGNMNLSGGASLTMYGLLYTMGDCNISGGSTVFGGLLTVATEHQINASGQGSITTDSSIMARLPNINPNMNINYSGNAANVQEVFY